MHARAERRLAAAEASLADLGWRARGGRGHELRGEIALQHSALTLVEEKLAELKRERKQLLDRLALAEQAPARPRRPEIGAREQRERQLSLDLGP